MEGTASAIIVKRKRPKLRKAWWAIGGLGLLILIGITIQFRMTWSREQYRGIGDDAVFVGSALKEGFDTVIGRKK